MTVQSYVVVSGEIGVEFCTPVVHCDVGEIVRCFVSNLEVVVISVDFDFVFSVAGWLGFGV